MNYDGVITRLEVDNKNLLYLFILDHENDEILDGINISEHKCYDELKENQLMVVDLLFKDGTLDLDNVDLREFIYGDKYGENNIFLSIKDVVIYSVHDNKTNTSLIDLIKNGSLPEIAKECIKNSKELNIKFVASKN